jgi:hypothetical protein
MRVLQILTCVEAATFGLAALLHLGFRLGIAEPIIVPAASVESLAATGLAVSAFGLLTRRPWAQAVTLAAYAFAIGGVMLGMAALAAGRGPHTPLNDAYHRLILAALLGGVALQVLLQRARPATTRRVG